jgi:hypothetical protein
MSSVLFNRDDGVDNVSLVTVWDRDMLTLVSHSLSRYIAVQPDKNLKDIVNTSRYTIAMLSVDRHAIGDYRFMIAIMRR